MTVMELIRDCPPSFAEIAFEAEDENGHKRIFCMSSFACKEEFGSMLKQWPTLPKWNVTKAPGHTAKLDV